MQTPADAIIDALIAVKGTDPCEWEFKINDYVDLTIINLLYEEGGKSWELKLKIAEHDLYISADGSLIIDDETFNIQRIGNKPSIR